MIVLICEDHAGTAQLWERYLSKVASVIRITHDLDSALEAMREEPPADIVLLDLYLPGSDAKNTLAHVEAFKVINPKAIVIAITGSIEEELPKLAEKLGADSFVVKHRDATSQRSLLNVVSETIRTRRLKTDEPLFEGNLAVLERLSELTLQKA